MKKRLCALCALVCMLSGTRASEAEVTTVAVWASKLFEGAYQQSIDNFNEAFAAEGLAAELHTYDTTVAGNRRLEIDLQTGGADVDVFISYSTQALATRASMGVALDLSELCQRDGFDITGNFSDYAARLYYEGKPYSVPSSKGLMGIMLNRDMFEEAGIAVPTQWTFKEFREIAARLTHMEGDKKVYGVFWNTNNNVSEALLHLALPILGGDPLYIDENESNLNHPVLQEALQLMYDTMKADGSAPTHEESTIYHLDGDRMFFDGECAMSVTAWSYAFIDDLERYPHDFVTAFAPWPVTAYEDQQYTQGSLGGHLSINPCSPNIEAAWTFIKWYSTVGNLPMVIEAFIPPYVNVSRQQVAELLLSGKQGLIDEQSAVALFLNPAQNLSVPAISNKIAEVTEVFEEAVEDVLIDGSDINQTLTEAKTKADELLSIAAP